MAASACVRSPPRCRPVADRRRAWVYFSTRPWPKPLSRPAAPRSTSVVCMSVTTDAGVGLAAAVLAPQAYSQGDLPFDLKEVTVDPLAPEFPGIDFTFHPVGFEVS